MSDYFAVWYHFIYQHKTNVCASKLSPAYRK